MTVILWLLALLGLLEVAGGAMIVMSRPASIFQESLGVMLCALGWLLFAIGGRLAAILQALRDLRDDMRGQGK